MKKSVYLFTLLTLSNLFINCSDHTDGLEEFDESIQFNPTYMQVSEIKGSYHITLNNESQALLFITNKYEEGDYTIVSENKINDTLKTTTCNYTSSFENYSGKSGTIILTPDSYKLLSGTFTILVTNLEGKTLKIKCNTSEALYDKIGRQDPFKTETGVHSSLDYTYLYFLDLIKDLYLFDVFYTNQIDIPSFKWGTIATHTQNSENEIIKKLWKKHYLTIRYANSTIAGALQFYKNNNPTKLNLVLGQVKLMRAYSYLQLTNWFGEIPLYTQPITTEQLSGKSTQEETYKTILEDLDFATQSLPSTWEEHNNLRVNNDFAKVISARLHFSMKNYQQAIDILLQIDDSYSLSPDKDNFEESDVEVIFGFTNPNTYHLENSSFQELYENSYTPIIRYTEVVLLLAECYNQTGNTTKATEYLNLLKERRNTPLVNMSTSEELTETIFEQWLSEMNFNGNRFSILKKFTKAKELLTIESYQLLLPIPQAEIDLNSEITQNPGY